MVELYCTHSACLPALLYWSFYPVASRKFFQEYGERSLYDSYLYSGFPAKSDWRRETEGRFIGIEGTTGSGCRKSELVCQCIDTTREI